MPSATIDRLEIEIEASAQNATKVFDTLEKSMSALKGMFGGIDTSGLNRLTDSLNKVSASLDNLASKMKTVEKIKVAPNLDASGVGNAGKQIEKDIDKVKDKMARLGSLKEAFGNGDASAYTSFSRLATSIQGDIDVLKSKIGRLGDVKIQTDAFVQLDNQIEKLNGEYETLKTKMTEALSGKVNLSDGEMTQLKDDIFAVRSELDALIDKQNEMVASGEAFTNPFETAVQGLSDSLSTAKQEMEDTRQSMNQPPEPNLEPATSKFDAFKQVLGTVGAKLSEVATKARTLGGALLSAIGKGIISGFKSLGNSIKNLASRMTGATKGSGLFHGSLKSGLMTVLKYGFGIRSLYVLFRRLRKAVTESFKELQNSGAFVQETRSNIESLKLSLATLKYQFGAAFQPIFNAVAPALQTLINYLVAVMNTISAFMAKIYGKDVYSKAVANTAALAKNTSGAAKAQKDLNKQLQGFDELNNLTSNDNKGGGGGGSAGDIPGATYVTESVDNALGDFGKKLAEMIKKGDWEGVGSAISEKLTGALNGIEWDKVFEKFGNFGTNLANFLNGLIKPELFNAVGTSIGNALNAVLTGALNFGKTFNFKNLGTSIAEGINGFVKTNPLKLAVENFNVWALGILDTLTEAVKKIKWKEISKHIAEAIGKVDAKGFGSKLGGLVNALTDALYDLLGNKDTWKNTGKKIGQGLSAFIKKVNWKKVGLTMSSLAVGILNMTVEAINNTDWEAVGEAIADMLAGIDWEGLAGGLSTLLLSLVSGAFQLLFGFSAGLTKSLSDFFESIGCDGIAGFFKGISDNIKTSAEWVKEQFGKIITAVKDFFGIHSPSTVFADIGKDLINGLFKGIKDIMSGIATWVMTNIITPFTNAMSLDAFIEKGKTLINNIKLGIDSVKSTVVDFFKTNVADKIKEKWDAIKEFTASLKLDEKFDSVVKTITDAKDKWVDWAKNSAIDLKTTITEKASKTINNVKKLWEGLGKTKELKLKASADTSDAKKALDGVKSTWDGLRNNSSVNLTATFNDTFSDRLINAWNNVANAINSAINKMKEKDPNINITTVPIIKKATGGILTNATPIIAGEAGAEAVVPLERNIGWLKKMSNMMLDGMEDASRFRYSASPSSVGYASNAFGSPMSNNSSDDALIAEQNRLLEEQNRLLQQIANKDYTISSRDIFKATLTEAQNYNNKTGSSPYVF